MDKFSRKGYSCDKWELKSLANLCVSLVILCGKKKILNHEGTQRMLKGTLSKKNKMEILLS